MLVDHEELLDHWRERGLVVRTSGDTIALSPPLVISAEELDEMFDLLAAALDGLD